MISKIKTKLHIIKTIFVIVLIIIFWYFIDINFKYFLSFWYFWLNKDSISKDIIVVAIDDKTLNSEKFWRLQDFSRADYAQLLRNILYWEPKIIWVDIFFFNKSENKSDDRQFQEIINKNRNIILSNEIDENYKIINPFIENIDSKNLWYVNVWQNYPSDLFWISFNNRVNSIPIIENDKKIFPLFLSVYNYLNNINENQIKIEKNYLKIQDTKIPLNDFIFNINFFGNENNYIKNEQIVSFIDVLMWKHLEIFKDKIVFIWSSALDIHDLFLTPGAIDTFLPWVLLHTNAFNTLEKQKFVHYPKIYEFLIIFWIFVLILYLWISHLNIFNWFIFSIFSLIFILVIFPTIFYFFWYFLDLISFIVWIIIINLYIYLEKYFIEKKSKDKIKSLFSKYVSQDVVNEIIKIWSEEKLLWWQRKICTIFFSDMVWFTSLSENLDPQILWNILNYYFEQMSNIILKNKWTIDKFMWDWIMAFWNAPLDIENHEQLACLCAIEQYNTLEKIKEKFKEMNIVSNIDIRIWINTWVVTVWNFWSNNRFEYTILWDNVNLASRLESINKQYWINILISQETYFKLNKDYFFIREIDNITVKWKKKPVKIYQIIWKNQIDQSSENTKTLINEFEKWLYLYYEWDFLKAQNIFSQLMQNDNPSKLFFERCEYFIKNPPIEWKWVFNFETK